MVETLVDPRAAARAVLKAVATVESWAASSVCHWVVCWAAWMAVMSVVRWAASSVDPSADLTAAKWAERRAAPMAAHSAE